jgi:ABC-type microcin C transport system duplicated ATPase subunit YejF
MRFIFNPFTGQLDLVTNSAAELSFDNTGTGLAADDVQDALVELDSRSIFLRRHELTTDFMILPGYFALWVDHLEIADGVELALGDGATLEVT